MINKPSDYINLSTSCINLTFSSNANLTKTCPVEQSLYETCHHYIIHGCLNFFIPLPPSYVREIWNYESANIG